MDEDIQPLIATIGQPFSFDIGSTFAGYAPRDISVSVLPPTSIPGYLWLNSRTNIYRSVSGS